jgi:hypothetical protein
VRVKWSESDKAVAGLARQKNKKFGDGGTYNCVGWRQSKAIDHRRIRMIASEEKKSYMES